MTVTIAAIRSGDCLRYAKSHLIVIIVAALFGAVSVSYFWSWVREIYQSSEMTPPEFSGLDMVAMPRGTRVLRAHFIVERNERCHLEGSQALIRFTPPDDLDKYALAATQSRDGKVSVTTEHLTLWMPIVDEDWTGWRYSYEMYYVCEPLGLIHWAYQGGTADLP